MGWRDLMGAPAEAEPPYTQNPHNPQNPRPPLNFGDIGDFGYMPPAPESEPVPILAAAVDNSGAVDNSEPTAHCERCGSPSWWRAADGAGWRCSWCEPRPQPLPAGAECVTLFSGQWAPGCAPPVPTPTTVAELLALHGETVAGCLLADVLEQADPDDLAELRDRDVIEGFALALAADRRVRPLPDPALSPLERLAVEIGDGLVELRRWLDQTVAGRRVRAWLERTPGAADRALLALRADPAGGLLLVLDRARASA